MEVNDMKCSEVKNFIIESDGKFEKLSVPASILAELNSHVSSCEKCSALRQRMNEMTSAIVTDRVPETPGLAAEIARKVIAQKTAAQKTAETPGFFEKIAGLLGIGRESLVPAFSAIALILAVCSIAGYLYLKSEEQTAGRIASGGTEKKLVEPASVKKQVAVMENEIKTANGAAKEEIKKTAAPFVTVASGKFAGTVPEDFSGRLKAAEGAELKINYKNSVSLAFSPETKFSFTGSGVEIETGSVAADVYVKTHFAVATPEAIAEVSGTAFSVSRANGETQIAVTQGTVRVTDLISCEVTNLAAGSKKSVSSKKQHKEARRAPEELAAATASVALTAETSETLLHGDTVETKADTKVINLIDKLKNDNINGGKK